jgi:hypothetical protein
MGACGCGDTRVDVKLPGPDGITYGIQVYAGCDYCGTPAGIIVYRFCSEQDECWHRESPEPQWNLYQGDSGTGEFVVPILSDDEARKVAESAPKRGMRDWIDDGLTGRIHEAVYNTIDTWLGELRHPTTPGSEP